MHFLHLLDPEIEYSASEPFMNPLFFFVAPISPGFLSPSWEKELGRQDICCLSRSTTSVLVKPSISFGQEGEEEEVMATCESQIRP